MVMTLTAMASAPALAACPAAVDNLITVTGSLTNEPCIVVTGQSLTVDAGVVIQYEGPPVEVQRNQTPVNITNNGTIETTGDSGAIYSDGTTTNITNNGTISGGGYGVFLDTRSGTTNFTNSGIISGGTAFLVRGTGSLLNMSINGNNTAKFIGAVDAPATPVTVNTGATYTMDNGQQFTVSNFTNAGTLKIGADSTATVTGNFTNTGTFSPTVSNTAFGKLNVSGTATLGGVLAVDASTMTAERTLGNSLSGVITAGALTGTFSSVSDNSTLFDFTPSYTGTGLDLTIAATAPSTSACPAASGNLITVGASTEVGACSPGQNDSLIVQADGKISGGTEGVVVGAGAASRNITNSGSISGTAASISLGQESALFALTNEAGGSITGGAYGVKLVGDSYLGNGPGRQYATRIEDFKNSGTISGTDTGIRFEKAYAQVSNLIGSTISGGTYGINLVNDSMATINNAGTISGGATGASIGISGAQTLINQIYNTGTINGALSGIESTGGEISNLSNDIENGSAATISGSNYGIYLANTKIINPITNSGTISGGDVGIRASGTTNINSITNSGVITGGESSVFVTAGATLNTINISGNNTAEFNGKVDAPNTDVSVSNGGTYTMKDGQHFAVKSFKNFSTLKIGAGSTATVTGDFANYGTFSPAVSDTAGVSEFLCARRLNVN